MLCFLLFITVFWTKFLTELRNNLACVAYDISNLHWIYIKSGQINQNVDLKGRMYNLPKGKKNPITIQIKSLGVRDRFFLILCWKLSGGRRENVLFVLNNCPWGLSQNLKCALIKDEINSWKRSFLSTLCWCIFDKNCFVWSMRMCTVGLSPYGS